MKDQFNISGILNNGTETDERMEGVLNSMLGEITTLNPVSNLSIGELLQSINSDYSDSISELNDYGSTIE